MNEAVRKSLAKLPEQISAYAPTLAARMLAALQERLARDAERPGVTHAALMLKLGARDLAQGFAAHVVDVLAGKAPSAERPAFAVSTISGMTLEAMEGPDAATLALKACGDRFKALAARAKRLGLRDFRPYEPELFLAALRDGLARARIDADNQALLMPHACAALDAELQTLYGRFEAMLEKIEKLAGA